MSHSVCEKPTRAARAAPPLAHAELFYHMVLRQLGALRQSNLRDKLGRSPRSPALCALYAANAYTLWLCVDPREHHSATTRGIVRDWNAEI